MWCSSHIVIVYVFSLILRFARHEIFNLLLQSYRSIPIVSLWITPSLWLGRITCFRFSSWQHQYRVLWPFFKDWFSFTLFHVSYSFLLLFGASLTWSCNWWLSISHVQLFEHKLCWRSMDLWGSHSTYKRKSTLLFWMCSLAASWVCSCPQTWQGHFPRRVRVLWETEI